MTVYVRKGESLNDAVDRFSRKVEKSGITSEYKARAYFKSKKQIERSERNKKRTRSK